MFSEIKNKYLWILPKWKIQENTRMQYLPKEWASLTYYVLYIFGVFSLIPVDCSVVTGYYITVYFSPRAGTIMFNIWMN